MPGSGGQDYPRPVDCARCGNANREGARFCDSCGAPLEPDEAGPDPRPVAPVAVPDDIPPPPAGAPRSLGDGRLEVVGFLGESGRKRVYLARDAERDGSLVAVAAFDTEGMTATIQARSRREAEAVARLGSHRHIVTVLASGQDGERPYVVSEYMPGGNLRDLLDANSEGRLEVDRALAVAADVAAGLEHAHSRGVIHRDLKPVNIWLDADGSARLGDFGLAVTDAASRQAVERIVVGTAAYIPPEQAVGGRVDARADLYSLGAVLYEMLTGEPPFPGDDAVSIISRHLSAAPVAPSRQAPGVPRAVDEAVLGLLAKSADDRPASARALRATLRSLAASPADDETAEEAANPLDSLAGGIFVGREVELGQLKDVYESAVAGRGGVVVIEGEPGIGKTRLLEELVTYARLRGGLVLSGTGHEADTAPAYWPFAQAIRSYVREADPVGLAWQLGVDGPEIARIAPELRERVPSIGPAEPIEGDEARFRFFEAVASFLAGVAASRPLTLALDDLHWADSSSIELLRFLTHRVSGSRLLIAVTCRPEEAGEREGLQRLLADLDEVSNRLRLSLGGLDREAVARFIELTVGQQPAAALVDGIHERAGGNPFFVAELVRLIASEGDLDGLEGSVGSIPRGVTDAVRRRIDRLEPATGTTLEVAAVLGRRFERRLVEEVAGEGAGDALEEAVACRILRRGAEPASTELYEFAHAVFREAVYEQLEPDRRADLHLRAGEAIEHLRSAEQLPALARHFIAAGERADAAKGLDYALRAGRQAAAQLAHADAAEHLGRALELLAGGEDRAGELALRLELGDELIRSGRFRDARKVLDSAADLARELGDVESLAHAAVGVSALSQAGVRDEGIVALLESALEAIGDGRPALTSRLLIGLAQEHYWGDAERSAALAEEAERLAREAGDDLALAEALSVRQFSYVHRPEGLAERLERSEELLEVARRCGDRGAEARAHAYRLTVLLQAGDVEGCDRDLAEYEALAGELGEPRYKWHVPLIQATRALMEGRFAEARELSAEGARLGRLAEEPLSAQLHVVQLCQIHGCEGTVEEMLPVVRRMADRYPAIPAWRLSLVSFLVEADRPEEAHEELAPLLRGGLDRIPRDANWLVGMARLGEAAAALGEIETCREILEMLDPYQGSIVVIGRAASCDGPIERTLGVLASAVGELDRAIGYFERAIEACERIGERPYRAITSLHLGRVLLERGSAGDRERALEALGSALDQGQAMRMRKLVERTLRARLQAQGISEVAATDSIDSVAAAVADERPDLSGLAAGGRVSILFSDIENSTLINERLGDERWIALLREHNSIFRRRVAEHGGYEVKNQGDGFMLAFGDPEAALACAVDVQRDLASRAGPDGERIRVRIGGHLGAAIAEDGDYFGRTVVLAARIAAQAAGGEILISDALREQAAPTTVDAGRELELKGLAGTHRVYVVRWDLEAALV
jgi:eukaryotic-like serine/threonine-protein kinase